MLDREERPNLEPQERYEQTKKLYEQLATGKVSRRVFMTRALGLGLALPTIGGLLAACGGGNGGEEGGGATTAAGGATTGAAEGAPEGEPVLLGLMPPLTGLVSLYGPEISHAGQIATDEVNAAGGVLGRPLELVIQDDGSLPDTAVPAAERLIKEKNCVAIIGNLLSNSRIAVDQQVAVPLKTPHLNFSFYEGSICSHYFFHFAALPNQQIDKMIPWMAENHGPKMYFAGDDYEWPHGSIDACKNALTGAGGEILGEEYFPLGTNEFSALLGRVKDSGADVFVPFAAGTDQQALLKQFTAFGLKESMAVAMAHYDEAMMPGLEPEVRKDFYVCNTYFMSLDTPENQTYLAALDALPDVNGIWPDGDGILTNFGEGTYLCVHAFAKAANAAGSTDSEAVVEALKTITVTGPQGEVVMDPETHHAAVNTFLVQCTAEGTFPVVESFGRLDPVIPELYAPCVADSA
jgi:ABC-type branched-subunit amino acid transport system substrate-binding protein